MRQEAQQVIGSAIAEMGFGCPAPVQRALTERLAGRGLGYTQPADVELLQQAVAQWQREVFGFEFAPSQVRPVVSLVTGFQAVLDIFVPAGAPIIVPTPAYMPFVQVPRQLGYEVIEVPMLQRRDAAGVRWEYDFAGLRAAFARGARLLVLCNPHNPIGKVATASELAQIEELVAEFSGLVFADEIHAPIILGETQHISYAARTARAASHTITGISATKGFNIPGALCGELVFTNPAHLCAWQKRGALYEQQASALGMLASAVALRECGEWLRETVDVIRGNFVSVLEQLSAAPETGIYGFLPEATYLLWLDVRESVFAALAKERIQAGGNPDTALADVVRERAGVAVTDGALWGQVGRGHVRLNLALPRADAEEAMRRIIAAARG